MCVCVCVYVCACVSMCINVHCSPANKISYSKRMGGEGEVHLSTYNSVTHLHGRALRDWQRRMLFTPLAHEGAVGCS